MYRRINLITVLMVLYMSSVWAQEDQTHMDHSKMNHDSMPGMDKNKCNLRESW